MRLIISIILLFNLLTLNAQHSIVASKTSSDSDIRVLISLAPDCPISLKYIKTLKELPSIYSDTIRFIGIFPKTYDQSELNEFHDDYGLNFDLIIDPNNELIVKYGISVTPEVVLIKEDTVFYQGAIDNWFYALGKNRAKPTEHFLIDAIDEVLAGKKVKVNKTEAIGCIISK